jgi:hypothetical protein
MNENLSGYFSWLKKFVVLRSKMKLLVLLGVIALLVYVEAAVVPLEQAVEDSPESKTLVEEPAKAEESTDEQTRQKRQFGIGGFGIPGIGFGGYAPGFGYGGYPGGYGGYGGYGESCANQISC